MTHSVNLPTAVVLGLSPTGLYAVRALGRAGVPVIGFEEGYQCGRKSRYLKQCLTANSVQEKLNILCDLFEESANGEASRPVLIPSSDQDVEFIISHKEQLIKYYNFQSSYCNGLAESIMTKDSFYKLCDKHDVLFPSVWNGTKSELAQASDKLAYPCIVKPSRIHIIKNKMKGKKGWIIRSKEEFNDILANIPDTPEILLCQMIVPGSESEITLCCVHVDSSGKFNQSFTARKLRQYPPGFGSASLVQSSLEHRSEELTTSFLSAIGFEGIAAAEFKRNPETDQLYLIEINVRPSLWFSVSEDSGKHVVLSAYYELSGVNIPLEDKPQSNGVRWCYAVKDTWSKLFYLVNRDFILPAPRANIAGPYFKRAWAVYASDDPLPVFVELSNFIRKLAMRLFRKSI